MLALRQGLPSYDERFRGFFRNKITYMWHLHSLGYEYMVEGGAFVVHYPHVKQKIWHQMQSDKHREVCCWTGW